VNICSPTHTHTHTHTHAHTHTHTHTQLRIHASYTDTHTCVYIYVSYLVLGCREATVQKKKTGGKCGVMPRFGMKGGDSTCPCASDRRVPLAPHRLFDLLYYCASIVLLCSTLCPLLWTILCTVLIDRVLCCT